MARVLTYNVHRCLGTDGRYAPERIAEVIGSAAPDIVALQELDVGRARSGGVDQAELIALDLGMRHIHFGAALTVLEERYGNAILTALPSRLVKKGPLPGLAMRPLLEPRGAIWASLKIDGADIQIINTHLGLIGGERLAQIERLLGPEWLGCRPRPEHTILLGDFNATPFSRTYRQTAATFEDAQRMAATDSWPQCTFPSCCPVLRIDHVFVGKGLIVRDAKTVRSRLARVASDHLPLMAEIELAERP